MSLTLLTSLTRSSRLLRFAINQIQTDNGSEFSEAFSWHLEGLGIEHRKTKVRHPEENGKVERSHRTDNEEFYGINRFVSIKHCMQLLKAWGKKYNHDRPHISLGGKTPGDYLAEKLQNNVSASALTVPLKSVQEVG